MAILIYSSGASGGSADNIVRASVKVDQAIGMRETRKPLYWYLKGDRRKYMHGIPVLEPKDRFIIRYGFRGSNLTVMPGLADLQDTFEKRRGMHITANKYKFREWAMENDIPVPLTWTIRNEPEELPLPILGRPLRHRKGRNYWIYNTVKEYESDKSRKAYYSQLLPKVAEYRIFVFCGYTWAVAQKHPKEGVGEYDPWNFSAGNAVFKLLRNDAWSRSTCRIAMQANFKLGLLFSGVDAIQTASGTFIVEINNAPSIDGKIKTRNFGILIDNLIERWEKGEEIEIIDPSTVKKVRHPVLGG